MPNLTKQNHCTGCTACASACPMGCITMVPDENGFCYPNVEPDACIGCGLCEQSCPLLSSAPNALPSPVAFAAYTKDDAVRMESSSGGIFTELARTVLAQGGAVYGAAYNDRFQVIHVCAEDESALAALRGAKYTQSNLCGIFPAVKKQLDSGRAVLFSGTSCQVAGLKAFLRRDYEKLLTVDFVCHSVPSPMVWEQYLATLGDVRSINLRAKDKGWSRYAYCHRVEADGETRLIPNGKSLYMKLFIGGYITRESCGNCQFKGYSRVSDLTLGDFWGIWDIAPEMDDDKGTSVVLAQSSRGVELLERIADQIVLKEVSLDDASRQNQAILKISAPNARRRDALALIKEGRIAECEKWFVEKKASLYTRAKLLIKRVLRKMVCK